MARQNDIQWYGKLPSAGDYVQRRMSPAAVTRWSNWFQQGLKHWQQYLPSAGPPGGEGPVWNFVLPATLGEPRVQVGCLLSSHDKVGRLWPLLALQSFSPRDWHPSQLNVSGEWFHQLGSTIAEAIQHACSSDELDARLQAQAALPAAAAAENAAPPCQLAWQEVARRFDPARFTSYWWTDRQGSGPLLTHRHSGNLSPGLFTQLFHPAANIPAGRRGLYPPMFD